MLKDKAAIIILLVLMINTLKNLLTSVAAVGTAWYNLCLH